MTTLRSPRARRVAVLLASLLLLVSIGPLMALLAGTRVRALATSRGVSASWRSLRVAFPARVILRDFVVTAPARADTLFRAGSLALSCDPFAFALLRTRVVRASLAHAEARLPAVPQADLDTMPPEDAARPRTRREDPRRAQKLRRSVASLVQLLTAPARKLPRLELNDVTLLTGHGDERLWNGVRFAWLEVAPAQRGVRLAAVGAILGEREIPFEISIVHAGDDRLTGGARIGIPDLARGTVDPLVVRIDGAVAQDRRAGRVVIADTTRIVLGRLPLVVGGSLARTGPEVTLHLEAADLTESSVKSSLPPAVLGPLREVGVRGSWDYRLDFHLDLARPDSVEFQADVIPRGLGLDPDRTRLGLLALDDPFVARIHLPHDRVVLRELSAANPHYLPLEAISPALVFAVLANEDGAFFRHRGFNTEAVKRAIAENIRAGAYRRGAGTITMQLVRNLYLGHERTLSRKFQEVVLAWVLENLTGASKQRLLEIYLNIIEWGPDVHGADEAARYYFDRGAGDLTVPQALFLATVIPAPSRWRSRFDSSGRLRGFVRAQMHFIGRAMVAKSWLAPEALPPSDLMEVELAGPARRVLFPEPAGPDTTVIEARGSHGRLEDLCARVAAD